MAPADVPEALDLWVATWTAAYPDIDFEARRSWFIEHVRQLQREGAVCTVAVQGTCMAGLLVIDPGRGYLDQILVGRAHQGSGLANVLMGEAKRISPRGFALDVNADNLRAIRFYERHGLRRISAGVNPRSGAPTLKLEWRPEGYQAASNCSFANRS